MRAVIAARRTAASVVVSRGGLAPAWWRSRLTPAWWSAAAAALVVFALDLVGELRGGGDAAAYVYVAVMVFVLATGLTIWATRPQLNPIGPLWTWFAILHVVENLPAVYPTNKAAVTVGILLGGTGAITGGWFILAYPTGKLPNRWARLWVFVTYSGTWLWNLAWVLYL